MAGYIVTARLHSSGGDELDPLDKHFAAAPLHRLLDQEYSRALAMFEDASTEVREVLRRHGLAG